MNNELIVTTPHSISAIIIGLLTSAMQPLLTMISRPMSFSIAFGGFERMTEGEVPVNVALASSVALECDVVLSMTNPPPSIVWRTGDGNIVDEEETNNGRRFLDGGRFLYISSLVEGDFMTTYRCEVNNAFLDRTIRAPTTYVLRDNLTRAVLVDYKQIGDLTAFVGNTSFEFAFIGGWFSAGDHNGTANDLFRDETEVPSVANIGRITNIDAPGTSTLRARVRIDANAENRPGTLTVHRKCNLRGIPYWAKQESH